MTQEQQKFCDIKNTTGYTVVGDDVDFLVKIDDTAKTILLQFKETDSEIDWKCNFSILPCPLRLDNKVVWTTMGYAKEYKSAGNIPIDLFCNFAEEHPDYKVIIRGWSLGSALCKIAARHFVLRTGRKIDELTTYGDVKCWLNPFYSVKKYCNRIREYVYINDIVTWCVPFYRRDVNCRVGGKFSIKGLLNTRHNHEYYEEYDYSKYE